MQDCKFFHFMGLTIGHFRVLPPQPNFTAILGAPDGIKETSHWSLRYFRVSATKSAWPEKPGIASADSFPRCASLPDRAATLLAQHTRAIAPRWGRATTNNAALNVAPIEVAPVRFKKSSATGV